MTSLCLPTSNSFLDIIFAIQTSKILPNSKINEPKRAILTVEDKLHVTFTASKELLNFFFLIKKITKELLLAEPIMEIGFKDKLHVIFGLNLTYKKSAKCAENNVKSVPTWESLDTVTNWIYTISSLFRIKDRQ